MIRYELNFFLIRKNRQAEKHLVVHCWFSHFRLQFFKKSHAFSIQSQMKPSQANLSEGNHQSLRNGYFAEVKYIEYDFRFDWKARKASP